MPRSPRVIIADRPPAEQSCISRALVAAQTVSACANDRVNRPVDRPLSLYEARNAGIGRHYTRGYNQTLPRTSHAAIRRHVERDPTGATPAILIAHRTAAYITATLRARHTASDYSLQFFWQRPTTYGRAVSRRAATPRFCCLVTPCRQNLSHVAFTLGTPLRDPLPLWLMNKKSSRSSSRTPTTTAAHVAAPLIIYWVDVTKVHEMNKTNQETVPAGTSPVIHGISTKTGVYHAEATAHKAPQIPSIVGSRGAFYPLDTSHVRGGRPQPRSDPQDHLRIQRTAAPARGGNVAPSRKA